MTAGSLRWAVVIMAVAVFLAPLTGLWWLALAFGAVGLIPFWKVAQRSAGPRPDRSLGAEQNLLQALEEFGEFTPSTASLRSRLTFDEAALALEKLANDGHIEARMQEGAFIYALEPESNGQRHDGETPKPQPDNRPLSEL